MWGSWALALILSGLTASCLDQPGQRAMMAWLPGAGVAIEHSVREPSVDASAQQAKNAYFYMKGR